MTMLEGVAGEGEVMALRRVPEVGGAEFLRARFGAFEFARHAHDRVTVGLITAGLLRIERPGGSDLAGAGDLILFNHDQVHWGGAEAGRGWAIRSIYLDPATLAALAREQGAAGGTPSFPEVLPRDGDLGARFRRMHASFDRAPERLEAETRFSSVIAALLRRHAGRSLEPPALGREPDAVARARDYLEAHVAEPVRLQRLARVAGLSPYRLARAFTAALGMPPHGYQTHLRVRLALGLLREGRPVAEVAATCGFADQSHLTRAFKRRMGFTPGRFRSA